MSLLDVWANASLHESDHDRWLADDRDAEFLGAPEPRAPDQWCRRCERYRIPGGYSGSMAVCLRCQAEKKEAR